MSENTKKQEKFKNAPPYILVYDRPGDCKITIENLHIETPDGTTLIDDLNYEIPMGTRIAITGKNGSGKTTTAKALTGNYECGSGKVGVPANISQMIMSQEVFIPNVTLRAVLNKSPDESPVFKDEELTEVLRLVGHEDLIQHIPGQQTNILVDGLLEYIGTLDVENTAETDLIRFITLKATELAKEQFEVVQYMTQESKDKLFQGLCKNKKIKPNVVDNLVEQISNAVDSALLQPLYPFLDKTIEHEAHDKRGKIFPYTPGKANYFSTVFGIRLREKLDEYLANEDTDNKLRPIRINEQQRDLIVNHAIPKMKEEFKKHASQYPLNDLYDRIKKCTHSLAMKGYSILLGKNANILNTEPEKTDQKRTSVFNKAAKAIDTAVNGVLYPCSVMFNIVSSPTSYLFGQRLRANRAARDTRNALAYFMDTQVVKGGELRRRLSGGEKQRLIFAKALLHKPDLLIADEPTSALDEATGEEMYKTLMEKMPKTSTIVSIVHDKTKLKYHEIHGKLGNRSIEFSPITP